MKIKTTEIDWDTDGDEITESILPQEVEVEVDNEEEITDALSDKYGFCIFSLSYDVINKPEPVVKDTDELVEQIKANLVCMKHEDRLKVFDEIMDDYCKHCGGPSAWGIDRCHCNNDE